MLKLIIVSESKIRKTIKRGHELLRKVRGIKYKTFKIKHARDKYQTNI